MRFAYYNNRILLAYSKKKGGNMKVILMKQERLRRGWSQEFVGKQVNISKQSVYDIECLRRKPSYEVLVKLEDLFNMSHRQLFMLVDYIPNS